MIFYRCKCGERQSYGSMPPAPCQGCDKCKSNLASSPSLHVKPTKHKWMVQYEQNTGKKYKICSLCMYRKLPKNWGKLKGVDY